MKKTLMALAALVLCLSMTAQDFPYKKVLDASKEDLSAQKFKYNKNQNQMSLSFVNGWGVVASALSDMDIPAKNDYTITVQYGQGDEKAWVEVVFYDSDIYHKILTYAVDNTTDLLETKDGNGTRHQFSSQGYNFQLQYRRVEQKSTSTVTGSSDDHKVSTSRSSTEDYSYDKYVYTISTDVEPWSPYLDKQAEKAGKREAKGKKATSSESFM